MTSIDDFVCKIPTRSIRDSVMTANDVNIMSFLNSVLFFFFSDIMSQILSTTNNFHRGEQLVKRKAYVILVLDTVIAHLETKKKVDSIFTV